LERCLLGALVRQLPAAEALKQLPHQALSLYAHAAQSLVWNTVLSRRIRELGPRPVVGDLVFASDAAASSTAGMLPTEDAGADELLIDDEAAEGSDSEAEVGRSLPSVRVLRTTEEASAVQLTDVVLPLPGSDVEYPPALRSVYEEVSKEMLGLSLSDFHGSTLVPLSGSYRLAAVKPVGLQWKTLAPADASKGTLLTSDVAKLLAERSEQADAPAPQATEEAGSKNVPAAEHAAGSASEAAQSAQTAEPATSASGDKLGEYAAVTFSCTLPPSAYLTMLLREVTRQSTASDHLVR